MAIGWYPGHMNKARKEIIHALKKVHAVLELVDARLPYSSENPLLNELAGDKPILKILNKSDLADAEITDQWASYYRINGKQVLTISSKTQGDINKQIINQLTNSLGITTRPLRVMIVGIPNVGKSTLINVLTGKKIAKTGNEPAVTKGQQIIKLENDIYLVDTPGILWPKIEDQDSAYRLAVTGAIKNTAIELEDIALYALQFLQMAYPDRLASRFDLEIDNLMASELLEQIGRSRGCLKKGGVDYNKAAEVVLNDLRSGKFGLISLETPADIKEEPELPEG